MFEVDDARRDPEMSKIYGNFRLLACLFAAEEEGEEEEEMRG